MKKLFSLIFLSFALLASEGSPKLVEPPVSLEGPDLTLRVAFLGTHHDYATSVERKAENTQIILEKTGHASRVYPITEKKFYQLFSDFAKFYNGVLNRLGQVSQPCPHKLLITVTEGTKETFRAHLCTHLLTPAEQKTYATWASAK